MNEAETYIRCMSISFHYLKISSFLSTNHASTSFSPMQTIKTYLLSLPDLHLTPFQSTNTIADDINPLNYWLTADDFITLTLPSGQLLYALNPTTGTSLWWALRRLTRVITCAAIHSIPIDPSLPVAQRVYIPQFQFDCIAIQHPAILSTLNPDCMNPLYGYMSRENIQAWYTDFQNMGRQAVQWICTAPVQSAYMGLHSGWNWDLHYCDVSALDFPNRYLIKGPEGTQYFYRRILSEFMIRTEHLDSTSYIVPSDYSSSISDASSETSSVSTVYNEDIIMEDTGYGKQLKLQEKKFQVERLVRQQLHCVTPTSLSLC